MADQDQRPALGHVALALVVYLGYQRAGGIEDRQPTGGRLFFHASRNAVGAEYGDGLGRNLGEILDKNRALVFQVLDHVFIVDDFVPHIDGRAVFFQRALDDFDGAHDPSAKPAGLRQIDFHGTPVTQVAPLSFVSPSPRPSISTAQRHGPHGPRPAALAVSQPPPRTWRRRALCQKLIR